ncbi:fibroblast growth factor receptor substrate 2-like isoform X1 [Dunckerocampus dactyliophorus]|uniref:fibroblast growth factor receptor substrate 2-like isoform X1 n=1 Tax=Dunckerocampus dactyliophorus TaxID=161453 RepID=UPI002405ECDC|nr:fibroblast growth factor receptor substrate 2-like isoform X1 [Dunckerocampus dactyliophorus]XP_054631313.1 fibroblast growth factor receptor substrate 2-like isoform X1 [Dunckerocampus dactyliophorus]
MGSCSSCPEKELIPDNHQSKFKVINVDDDGNELGAGVMELTDTELVLHTHRRDDVKWPYLCLRRYGYDSNLFSFESGRRCQTGQGIFAFKCSRAEEIFNMLQEVMHSHSISVVEEAVLEPNHQGPLSPAALGYSVPTVPNGVSRIPSVGDVPSHPSSRHPSVASTRLPSVGEESTHPLLVADDNVHTYVNTTGLLEEQPSPLTVTTPLESPTSPQARCPPTPPPPPRVSADIPPPPEPQVLLEPQGVRFVLGPTPVQRRQQEASETQEAQETNGHAAPDELPAMPSATHSNGSLTNPAAAPRRHRPPPLTPDLQNVNNSAQRRTALLDYENLPALPPVWEARKPSWEDEEGGDLKTPSLNGFNHSHHCCPLPLSAALEPSHNYVNTENVTAPLSAHRPDTARRRTDGPTIFNFDFRRPPGHAEPPKTLNYIEVEMDNGGGNRGASDGSNPHTPRTPTSPMPPTTPTRRTELYALIDIERTAAMSNLQKARPRDDGTSRKTRHNSTELPTKSAA